MVANQNQTALGSTESSLREGYSAPGNVQAVVVCVLQSDGTLIAGYHSGIRLGVSLGGDLSNAGHSTVCTKGLSVPIRLAEGFTPGWGEQVYYNQETGMADAFDLGADYPAIGTVARYSKILSEGGVPEGGGDPVPTALIDFPNGL